MQAQFTSTTHLGHRSSLGTVACVVRWSFPLVAVVMVAAGLAAVVTGTTITSSVVPLADAHLVPEVSDPYPDTPRLIP
jgi:hypothetical protein